LEQDLVDFILTPSLMQQLQRSFPMLKRGDSFFLQYSLIRDGASLDTLLEKTQGTKHCVLAIETVEGEVFGAFLAQPLERSSQWTGSAESFLFAVEEKGGVLDSSLDNAKKIRVFKHSFLNPYVQLCQPDRLLIGSCDEGDDDEAGFGIALDGDLLSGTSNPCRTFASPSLSRFHANGSTFDVRNVEVWNLRPCLSIVEGQGQQVVHRRRRHRHCSRR
jgi:TLD